MEIGFNITLERKFILITLAKDLEMIVTFLWSNGPANLIVLVYDDMDALQIVTIDPQSPANNCGKTVKEFLSVGGCFDETPIRLPKVLRKYTNCNVTYIFPNKAATGNEKIPFFETTHFTLDIMADDYQDLETTTHIFAQARKQAKEQQTTQRRPNHHPNGKRNRLYNSSFDSVTKQAVCQSRVQMHCTVDKTTTRSDISTLVGEFLIDQLAYRSICYKAGRSPHRSTSSAPEKISHSSTCSAPKKYKQNVRS
ncbi:hypothetical protein FQR65_LT06259 [Abscondita terminalis]|nr:hypothetical protein FQR65_LT06259 [Abscondita terminalis]